jgi:glycosyltransferase involved in cell wall biosynthesis
MVHISPIENTWSNAIAEAMFMDVPVIMSNAGHTETTFTDQENCLIVPPRSPDALADALERLLHNAHLHASLITGARRLLRDSQKESYTIVEQTRQYYDQLAAWRSHQERG